MNVDSVGVRIFKPSGTAPQLTSDDSQIERTGSERLLNLASLRADGTLLFTDTGSADETITIAGVTYTLKAEPSAANEVDIGVDAEGTASNLAAAINLSGTEDTEYGAGTVAHPLVTASSDAFGVVTVTAKVAGTLANGYATTETSAVASWAAATLTGGEDLPLCALKKLVWPKEKHNVT